ncbi:MAG: acyl-ACP--UDP-N-acetylglucosamine O-acyltransferase [Acidobacteriota bacterium]
MSNTTFIDSRATVSPKAQIASGVSIAPYAVIGDNVKIAENCRIGAHAFIDGDTEIGENCSIFPFSSIGTYPQDLKFKGEKTKLRIGKNNTFREFITVNLGTAGGGGITTIGDSNFFMAYSHIAHDCHIGNGTIFANAATLAGHVEVEDFSTIGAFSGVHQFCRIGKYAFIGGYSVITQDALPYVLTVGNRAKSYGINVIGLQRRGFQKEPIEAIKSAYMTIFRSKMLLKDALAKAESEFGSFEEVRYFCQFIRASRRGVIR